MHKKQNLYNRLLIALLGPYQLHQQLRILINSFDPKTQIAIIKAEVVVILLKGSLYPSYSSDGEQLFAFAIAELEPVEYNQT